MCFELCIYKEQREQKNVANFINTVILIKTLLTWKTNQFLHNLIVYVMRNIMQYTNHNCEINICNQITVNFKFLHNYANRNDFIMKSSFLK